MKIVKRYSENCATSVKQNLKETLYGVIKRVYKELILYMRSLKKAFTFVIKKMLNMGKCKLLNKSGKS